MADSESSYPPSPPYPPPDVPAGPEAVTPAWLTQALRSAGILSRATVTSAEMQPLGHGRGFAGQLVRIGLVYDTDEPGAPTSLVAKFPAADPTVRATLTRLGLYAREVRFYQEVAPGAGIRTPKAYFGAVDARTGASVLLLEEVAPARAGDNLAGCTLDEAVLALQHLAAFHARWWDSPQLEQLDWLPSADDGAAYVQRLYGRMWGPFVERFGDLLPTPVRELGARCATSLVALSGRFAAPPRTLLHGDYRPDNLLFGPSGSAALSVVDWQLTLRGLGACDVGYFLLSCLPPEQRRAKERTMLETYCATLAAGGVRGYGPSECWSDYRLSTIDVLRRLVVSGALLDFTGARGRPLAQAVIGRCAAAIEDLDPGALLPLPGP